MAFGFIRSMTGIMGTGEVQVTARDIILSLVSFLFIIHLVSLKADLSILKLGCELV